MHTELVKLPRHEALKLYQQYKTHTAYSAPIDFEIQRAYHHLSKGRVIIKALESIKQAGLNRDFLPKLALTSAVAKHCRLIRYSTGTFSMAPRTNSPRSTKNVYNFKDNTFLFPAESFPMSWDRRSRSTRSEHDALVPVIPVHLRPKRGLENYSILWEAEWQPLPPRDPYLLRRIGQADLWLVVAHWDLTDVERAALSTRV